MCPLTIIIPVYNEQNTILLILEKLQNTTGLSLGNVQYVIVDDCSTDETWNRLQTAGYGNMHQVTLLRHAVNKGKGAAIRSALPCAIGEYTIIQDADLEYNPTDIIKLLDYAQKNNASVVYGSRNIDAKNRRGSWMYYWGGRFLSSLVNILYHQRLTDEATCYKLFKTSLLKTLPLTCERFEFCPEVTALIAKQGTRIPELAIAYMPRSKSEGKKISLWDGWQAVWVLVKYRFKK